MNCKYSWEKFAHLQDECSFYITWLGEIFIKKEYKTVLVFRNINIININININNPIESVDISSIADGHDEVL